MITKHEAKNQSVHFLIGTYLAVVLFFLNFGKFETAFFTFGLALNIELLQYYFYDNRDLKIYDRTMDMIFYILGAVVMWQVLDVVRWMA